jgi:hypothetical protein
MSRVLAAVTAWRDRRAAARLAAAPAGVRALAAALANGGPFNLADPSLPGTWQALKETGALRPDGSIRTGRSGS